MKPPVFDYYDPTTEDEALTLLAQLGTDAKLLAGGQSLMPLLNMRLVTPTSLLDLNRVSSLATLRSTPEALYIGAMVRQHQVEHSADIARTCPLLVEAIHHIGYPQIRQRGTIGGSLVHADPAAELGAVMTALEAEFTLKNQHGERTLTPQSFFVSYLTTAVEADELLCTIRVPQQPPRTGWSFLEVARVAGAFAIVAAAAVLTLDASEQCTGARLAFTGVGPVPQRAITTETLLQGQRLTLQKIQEAAQVAAAQLDPDSDIHASAAYRKHLANVLARRTLTIAWERARVIS